MRKVKIFACVALFLSLAAGFASADVVTTKTRGIFEGLIVSEAGDTLVIDVPVFPIRVTLFKGTIVSVRRGTSEENAELAKKIETAKKERGFVE